MSVSGADISASRIGLIWAQTPLGVIGVGGAMPWHVPEDLTHFRRSTEGHPVIMGRRTWESFPEQFRPLPGRTNYVLTSSDWQVEGARPVPDLRSALRAAGTSPGGEEIWIIGGGSVYEQALPLAETVVITYIDSTATGDTYAPTLGPEWRCIRSEPESGWQASRNGTGYRFTWWERHLQTGREGATEGSP